MFLIAKKKKQNKTKQKKKLLVKILLCYSFYALIRRGWRYLKSIQPCDLDHSPQINAQLSLYYKSTMRTNIYCLRVLIIVIGLFLLCNLYYKNIFIIRIGGGIYTLTHTLSLILIFNARPI